MAKVWPPQGDDSPSFAFKAVCCCVVKGPAVDVFETRWTAQNSEGVCMCGCPWHDKWWKVRTWSGTLHAESFESCDPDAAPLGPDEEEFAGSQIMDPDSCYPVTCYPFSDPCATSTLTQAGSPMGVSCNPMVPNLPADGYEETDTQAKFTGTGACQTVGGGAGVVVTGDATDTYSEEDDADDAIARMLSFAGASEEDGSDNWDIWTAADGSSFYLSPTSAACFAYQHGVWRIRRNHLLPSTEYTVSVELWRAAWDGVTNPDPGDYSLFATQEVVATTDADGFLKTVSAVIPNAPDTVTITKMSTLTCVPS